jgi:hypothetical protein
MRTAERRRELPEAHFTEGEPDLEPPEELAIGELDDEAILEEGLDNEDLLEQDVDEDTLEETLEDLVHGSDDEVGEGHDGQLLVVLDARTDREAAASEGPEDADEEFEAEDFEESLDLVLLERMALVDGDGYLDVAEDGSALVEHSLLSQMQTDSADLVEVAPCGTDEFVCQSCFLVRKRVQLVDRATMACHDCST